MVTRIKMAFCVEVEKKDPPLKKKKKMIGYNSLIQDPPFVFLNNKYIYTALHSQFVGKDYKKKPHSNCICEVLE